MMMMTTMTMMMMIGSFRKRGRLKRTKSPDGIGPMKNGFDSKCGRCPEPAKHIRVIMHTTRFDCDQRPIAIPLSPL